MSDTYSTELNITSNGAPTAPPGNSMPVSVPAMPVPDPQRINCAPSTNGGLHAWLMTSVEIAGAGGKRLSAQPSKRGKHQVTVLADRQVVYVDQVTLTSSKDRERYVKSLMKKQPGIDPAAIENALIQLVNADLARAAQAIKTSSETASPADLLIRMPQDIRDEAAAMLRNRRLPEFLVESTAAMGVAGEEALALSTYLVGTSRLLDKPLAGIWQGPSATGKSYIADKTSELFPPETVIFATQITPKALFHMPPGSLVHKFVVAGERSRRKDDEQAEATRALREMLASGRLTMLVPEKTSDGALQTVLIEQEGPIAFIETTSLWQIFDEDANRCILLHTDERPEQTAKILELQAKKAAGNCDFGRRERIIKVHHALQRMLQARPVNIPFAEKLASLFPKKRVEARRAFEQVLGMISACALLHQYQRELNANGQIVADRFDYVLARALMMGPLARQLAGQVSEPARRFYERLHTRMCFSFTVKQAQAHEGVSPSAVYGWVAELRNCGLILEVEPSHGRTAAMYSLLANPAVVGMNSTSGNEILPTVEKVFNS